MGDPEERVVRLSVAKDEVVYIEESEQNNTDHFIDKECLLRINIEVTVFKQRLFIDKVQFFFNWQCVICL